MHIDGDEYRIVAIAYRDIPTCRKDYCCRLPICSFVSPHIGEHISPKPNAILLHVEIVDARLRRGSADATMGGSTGFGSV